MVQDDPYIYHLVCRSNTGQHLHSIQRKCHRRRGIHHKHGYKRMCKPPGQEHDNPFTFLHRCRTHTQDTKDCRHTSAFPRHHTLDKHKRHITWVYNDITNTPLYICITYILSHLYHKNLLILISAYYFIFIYIFAIVQLRSPFLLLTI